MSGQSAEKRLAKGTIVYMIGNVTSKVLQMLILPIVTTSLLTEEYGYYDLVITTISLVTPVVTLQLIEGMFRFMFESDEEGKRKTASTVTAFLVFGIVILGIGLAIAKLIIPALKYPILIFFNYVASIALTYTQKLARCEQRNKAFAISGVLYTAVMLGCQCLFLLILKMRIDGMLLANCIAYLAASVFLLCQIKSVELLAIKHVDHNKFKELIKYSAPLVPNSIGWWVVASSDRYVITWFMGAAANGVYSIAGKFSQLLTFVTTVFQLAWQESAIMEENSEERDRFYTRTFNTYMKLLLGGYLVVLPFIKIIIPILLAESYQVGWLYNPILLIGAVFSAFSQFYGSAYLVFKKTGGAFSTTVVAAIINIAIGMGLIKWIGLFAPAFGTAVSFGVQWILRAHQMRDYFKVKIDLRSLFLLLVCGAVITFVYYMDSMLLQLLCMFGGIIVFLVVNKEMILMVLRKFRIMK